MAGRGGTPPSERVTPLYDVLREVARRALGGGAGHTLQPTAIVHEAWVRMASVDPVTWHDENHFAAYAARVIRSVLVDHHRARGADRRGGGAARLSLDTRDLDAGRPAHDPLEIEEALARLEREDPRAAAVVELRFFGGRTFPQIAEHLGISEATAHRDWRFARAWMHRELARAEGGGTVDAERG